MGSNTSKPEDQNNENKKTDSKVDVNSDPRSPTPEIIRTPLNNKTGTQHNITKNADLRKAFENVSNEEKLIHNNTILTAVIKNCLQSYDPRSPTQDFERTPIVITSKTDPLRNDSIYNSPSLLHDNDESNKPCPDLVTPKNLFNEFLDMTLNDTIKDSDEPLGSSTASKEAIEGNISHNAQPSKLLETSFDYIENNSNIRDNAENPEDETKLENIDARTKYTFFEILDVDPRSPSVGIERTPIVVPKKVEDLSDNNLEQMSDEVLIKALQNTNSELRHSVKPQGDISEGVLIYEDNNNPTKTPVKPKTDTNIGARTPLSCMKNKTETGHALSKSTSNLHDPKNHKISTKIPKRVSHIPRLKSLSTKPKHFSTGNSLTFKSNKTVAIHGGCENTPPQSHRDKWDQDNSIVL